MSHATFAKTMTAILLLALVACAARRGAPDQGPARNANQSAPTTQDAQDKGASAPEPQKDAVPDGSEGIQDEIILRHGTAKKGEAVDRPDIPTREPSEAELRVFIRALQKAVAADDRQKVASMVRYPIVIEAGGRSMLFRGPSSLVASYDLVFTPRRKKLIAKTRAEDLFSNWKGAMIDRGDIWINWVDSRALKIITINAEMGAKPPKPLAPELKVHPKVFSLIDYPRVKEVNLDDNQFQEEVKPKDGWTWCDGEDGRGFMRYTVVEALGNRYAVEYQDNAGGTLTEAAIIEFVVETRQVRTDGKLKSTRVLRVLAYTDL